MRRLRPLARRRFNTWRPFLVAMRTRNPCVRLRRRRFGWNVTLIVGYPLQRIGSGRETSIVTAESTPVNRGRECCRGQNPVLQSRPLRAA